MRGPSRHADGTGDAVQAISPSARSSRQLRRAARALSALHGDPGRGSGDGVNFVTAIDDLSRFRRSRDIAAYFGLTSRRWQSGTSIDVLGRISKGGDSDVRRALYEAASAMMVRFKGRDKVRTWGLALAKRSCQREATVAVARKLAVIMYATWTDGACCVGDVAASASDRTARAARKDSELLGAQV